MLDKISEILSNFFIIQWLSNNEQAVFWIAIISAAFFFLSLIIIPWLIIRIPPDYFSEPARKRSTLFSGHPLLAILFKMIRNTIAVFFILLGVLLLVLPGQGLLTILIGVFLADFPGKHRLVNWIVSKKSVMNTINWLRKKSGKEPIQVSDGQR